MKILVFGLPRTGTTIIQKCLATYYQIDNYNEPYTGSQNREKLGDVYHWTSTLIGGIVKLLSVNLDHIDFKKLINTGNFDFVVLTTRKNLVDSCASLYYAQLIGQYHFTQIPDYTSIPKFICPLEHVTAWIQQYRRYQDELQFLKNTDTPYYKIDYDDYLNDAVLKVDNIEIEPDIKKHLGPTINSNFDYKTLCLNYNEIEKLIYESLN